MVKQKILLELKNGEDIFECLKEFAAKEQISDASIEGVSGSIKDSEILSKGKTHKFKQKFKLESMSGAITKTKKGNYDITLRVTGSATGFTSVSGKLLAGKAAGTLKLWLKKSDFGGIIQA